MRRGGPGSGAVGGGEGNDSLYGGWGSDRSYGGQGKRRAPRTRAGRAGGPARCGVGHDTAIVRRSELRRTQLAGCEQVEVVEAGAADDEAAENADTDDAAE